MPRDLAQWFRIYLSVSLSTRDATGQHGGSSTTKGPFPGRDPHGRTSTMGRSWICTKVTRTFSLRRLFATVVLAAAIALGGPSRLQAQDTLLAVAANPSSAELAVTANSFATASREVTVEHHFWDKENLALFSTSAALSGADFYVTRSNLQSGGRELNPIVQVFGRSSAGLAMNFAGETAGVIAVSYLFHRTGHHRLERLTSSVNISASAGAVAYGLMHR